MTILAYILSGISLVMSVLFLNIQNAPFGWLACIPKMATGALSLLWALMGIVGAVLGWVYQDLWASMMGMVSAGILIWYIWRCTRNHNGFANAFGTDWSDLIKLKQAKLMAQKHRIWFLR